jgi:hypothetical protein
MALNFTGGMTMKTNSCKQNVLFFAFYLFFLIVSGCSSIHYSMQWKNPMGEDVYIPFEYFPTYKEVNERLVYVSPLLSPGHWFSNVYIITNSDDIQKAQDKFNTLGNLDAVPLKTIENTLAEFSAVKIQSTIDGARGDGIAIFHLPESADKIFYVYISYRSDIKYSSDYKTKVWCDITPLPSEKNDVYITFSENEGDMAMDIQTDSVKMKEIFTGIHGVYGWYVASKNTQLGFIDINFKQVMESYQIVRITPPPENIAPAENRERYVLPITNTLIGAYANYKITAHDIVGKSDDEYQLSKSQILDWLALNKDNEDFNNALAICMIIADKWDYIDRQFVCVDYCAMFIGIDATANNGRLASKIGLTVDKIPTHIWMRLNIPNKYYDANGAIIEASYLWVDPTWFDNDGLYNLNYFTWGGDYVPQFMEGYGGGGVQSHKYPERIQWERRSGQVEGFTYSILYRDGRYVCVEDDFGRRGWS